MERKEGEGESGWGVEKGDRKSKEGERGFTQVLFSVTR